MDSTNSLPRAALPLAALAGSALAVDFANRYFVIALISAIFRLSQSIPLLTPLLFVLNQNLGMRASDLKSFGSASHFWTHVSVNFPEIVERSGPTFRKASKPGIL